MAHQDRAPFVQQNPKEVQAVVTQLERGSGRKGKGKESGFSCRSSSYNVLGNTLRSWKFMDWDYKRDDLPTYARGLFTYKTRDGRQEIAIRGYDKFFNIDEVNDTKWTNIEQSTKGPYELSVKENGCIIFISGLEDGQLLVCSKHSTGAGADINKSHAVAGERWIDRCLDSVGRTRPDLARRLHEMNATAVGELCDDAFEEHVLEYDENSAGLYLHGINLNTPEFATYSGSMVHKFANEWGFKKAQYLMKDDIATVKAFLEGCAETGSWDGRDTEGFVIRCQRKSGSGLVDWFFKYKFEEPYLMYRQWREATKAVIGGKAPRYKKHKKITDEYLKFARRMLAQTPGLGKAYNQNHGIIKMRDAFLAERGLKGSDIIRQEASGEIDESSTQNATHNVLLVPIASIGCGKTTVALALAKLFGWGHVQNDNITGQKGRPKQFVHQITNNLAQYPAVIADRNNSQKRERKQIFDDVNQIVPGAKYVALHYVHEPKRELLPGIREVTQERVLERGDNHQTIHAKSKSREEIISIMEGFLHRFEAVDTSGEPDHDFDEVIDLEPTQDSRANLEVVVKAMHKAFPRLVKEMPTATELDEAIEAAMTGYTPGIKHNLSFNSKNRGKNTPPAANGRPESGHRAKDPRIEYFGARLPSAEVTSLLDRLFASQDVNTSRFYRQLQGGRRVQPRFHVTLIHRASMASHGALWDRMLDRYRSVQERHHPAQESSNFVGPGGEQVFGSASVELERVVWDDRVMCIVARLLPGGARAGAGAGTDGEAESERWDVANPIPHVTVGTANQNIKPKESNDLLAKWNERGSGGDTGVMELEIAPRLEVGAKVSAVMSR